MTGGGGDFGPMMPPEQKAESGPSCSHPIMPGPNGESVAYDSGLAAVGEVNVQ